MLVASISNAVTALSYGPEVEALRALGATEGRVLASLSNALYLQSDAGHIVCVVGPEAEDGPLTLRVSRLPAHVQLGSRYLLDRLGIEWGGEARAWRPLLPDRIGRPEEREKATQELGLILLDNCASHSPANEFAGNECKVPLRGLYPSGRGEACLAPTGNQVQPVRAGGLRRFCPRIHSPGFAGLAEQKLRKRSTSLECAIRQGHSANIQDAVLDLLGHGPGLTPSGDDIVMGALAMLVWRARLGDFPAVVLDSVAQAIRAEAPMRTNLISARLLYYACQGVLYAPAMELGAALLAGEGANIDEPARRLLNIGSSSGADMVVGLLAGLQGSLRVAQTPQLMLSYPPATHPPSDSTLRTTLQPLSGS